MTLEARLAQLLAEADAAPVVDVPGLLGALVTAEERLRLRLRAGAPVAEPRDTAGPPPGNISAREAARVLGVSPDYLYKQARAGRLPFAQQTGPRVVFDAAGVERWRRRRMNGEAA